jgi:hypothetical protein
MKNMALQKYQPLAIEKNIRLSIAQKKLFELICLKYKKQEKLKMGEIHDIWLSYSHKTVRDGVPYFWMWWWRNEKDEMVGKLMPMEKEQIKISVIMFLTHNLGRLILKGYLTVMPEMDLLN